MVGIAHTFEVVIGHTGIGYIIEGGNIDFILTEGKLPREGDFSADFCSIFFPRFLSFLPLFDLCGALGESRI